MISEGKTSVINNRRLFNKIQNVYEVDYKSLQGIGDEIWDQTQMLGDKYAYEIRYGDFGSPIQISDQNNLLS